ncbi:MAG: antibiotic biosynthesis monooxygenase family protein [Nocardioides sp.]
MIRAPPRRLQSCCRDGFGISVAYWRDGESAGAWKQVAEHLLAQERGTREWYAEYQVRVARVTRAYGRTSC